MLGPKPKPYINAIHAYTPGKAKADDGRTLIKLSANENPLGCSSKAAKALAEQAGGVARYPDPSSTELRIVIAKTYGLDADRIVCGTGSDEILNLVAQGYAGVGDEIIHVRFGFQVYEIATRKVGAEVMIAPDKDYATDVDAILACVTKATKLVYLANPNNPTGTFSSKKEIARLHKGLPSGCVLVLDQAYGEYLEDDGPAAFDIARKSQNVLVTRTFSKIYGLAAERIGWAYGSPGLIDTLNRIRGPFNVTSAGQAAAIAALKDQAFVKKSRTHNAKWRSWLMEEIKKLSNQGLRAIPSQGNFILVLFEGEVDAETADAGLIERGYVVRRLAGQGLGHALRITIGTANENKALIKALRDILKNGA